MQFLLSSFWNFQKKFSVTAYVFLEFFFHWWSKWLLSIEVVIKLKTRFIVHNTTLYLKSKIVYWLQVKRYMTVQAGYRPCCDPRGHQRFHHRRSRQWYESHCRPEQHRRMESVRGGLACRRSLDTTKTCSSLSLLRPVTCKRKAAPIRPMHEVEGCRRTRTWRGRASGQEAGHGEPPPHIS